VGLSDAGTLLANWKIESVSAGDGTKFTSWADSTANSHTLDQAVNGGLTMRAAATGFGGVIAAAEVAASTDGLYAASQAFGATVSNPWTIVAFGKANGAWTNGDVAIGNTTYYGLGKAAGFQTAGGSGGNAMFWSAQDTTVRVFTIMYNGGSSQLYWNTTQNGSNGNLGTIAFTGLFGIGKSTSGTGGVSLWNEVAVYSGDVTAHLSDVIVPYFRTKSGLALT
jgi:hypothetical protein